MLNIFVFIIWMFLTKPFIMLKKLRIAVFLSNTEQFKLCNLHSTVARILCHNVLKRDRRQRLSISADKCWRRLVQNIPFSCLQLIGIANCLSRRHQRHSGRTGGRGNFQLRRRLHFSERHTAVRRSLEWRQCNRGLCVECTRRWLQCRTDCVAGAHKCGHSWPRI